MKTVFLTATTLALSLVVAPSAHAQETPSSANPNCPPGSWFCADQNATPPPAEPPVAAPLPAAAPPPLPPATGAVPAAPLPPLQPSAPGAARKAPPVFVYQQAPPVVVVAPRDTVPPPYEYSPRPAASWSRNREWGVQLRLDGALMGHRPMGQNAGAGMGGLGIGLRYRPLPALAFQASFDFVGGRDYQAQRRDESAFSLESIVFLNPRSRLQVYAVGGFNWSAAHIRTPDNLFDSGDYTYFGASAGGGLELRVSPHFALNSDLRGFIRSRTDSGANSIPEFRNGTQTTNTSGGGLVTLGATLYF